MPNAAATLLLTVLALLAAPAAWGAPGFAVRTIAIEGDPAPGTSETYGTFWDVTLNESGEVAFSAPLENGPPLAAGVFVDSGSGPVLRMRDGQPAPGAVPGDYFAFGLVVGLDDAGRVSAMAVARDAPEGGPIVTTNGLFLDEFGADTLIVVEGDPAPSPPAGVFAPTLSDLNFFGVNGPGDVAFRSTLSSASTAAGLFVRTGGTEVLIAGVDGFPSQGLNQFQGFEYPAIGNGGEVAFVAPVTGTAASQGLFVDAGNDLLTLALDGDPAPDTGGADFDEFFFPIVTPNGDVAFGALTSGGTSTGGFFLATPAITSIVVDGLFVPGSGPISHLGSRPELAGDGTAAMALGFSGMLEATEVLLRAPVGTFQQVVVAGEPAPDSGGAQFHRFGTVALNDAGEVAFVATLDDGRTGIFLAGAPPTVPLLPAAAVPVLALLLLASAAVTRGRAWRGAGIPVNSALQRSRRA